MEQKLNIAKILKNKPRGTKLYSMIHGKCSFEAVTDEIFKINFCTSKFGLTQSGECTLIKFGNMYDGGECIIFPSKEMRDWSKFSWKKGDVLVSSDGSIEVIFDKWYDDTYTSFYCKHYLNSEDKNKIVYYKEFLCTTAKYSLEDKDAVQTYIKTIEEKLGGKLNYETLEIEKHIEFKDGDILSCDEDSYTRHTTLILHKDENITESIVSLVRHRKLVKTNVPIDNFLLSRLYPAREDEKKELFDALAKGGKAWDSEKKQIVDIKKEHQFKPFEKVLVRDSYDDMWRASFFSHIKEDDGRYVTTCLTWRFCVPYEGNEHLLGTTNNIEG